MNIIRMSGGLERQMFQYALFLKLESMGREVKFDDINEYQEDKARPIMLSVFNIDYPRASWSEINKYTDGATDNFSRIRRLFKGRHTNIYIEKGFYDPGVLSNPDVYLEGKFMSQKYFEDILPEIRKAYTFPDINNISLPPRANENFLIYYNDIINTASVGIHIRRSDSRYNEELYENICTVEYYREAIRFVMERVPEARFFVFSNEPKWIRGLIKDIIRGFVKPEMPRDDIKRIQDKFTLVEASDEYTSYLDMFLLSKCKHNILSNSSFSWWGAWLNTQPDKVTVAPSAWINGVDSSEIYTEGMVLINSKGRVERKVK